MERPAARPGPRDHSGPLTWPLMGVALALVVYIILLASPIGQDAGTVVYWIVAGAVGGYVAYRIRRRRNA